MLRTVYVRMLDRSSSNAIIITHASTMMRISSFRMTFCVALLALFFACKRDLVSLRALPPMSSVPMGQIGGYSPSQLEAGTPQQAQGRQTQTAALQ